MHSFCSDCFECMDSESDYAIDHSLVYILQKLYFKWIEICLIIIVIFLLHLFELMDNPVGEWRKENFNADFENIIGDHNSYQKLIAQDTIKCYSDKNTGIKKFSYDS